MVPFISDVMPCNRFLQILSHIHANDNNAMPQENKEKLYKLRSLTKSLNGNL